MSTLEAFFKANVLLRFRFQISGKLGLRRKFWQLKITPAKVYWYLVEVNEDS